MHADAYNIRFARNKRWPVTHTTTCRVCKRFSVAPRPFLAGEQPADLSLLLCMWASQRGQLTQVIPTNHPAFCLIIKQKILPIPPENRQIPLFCANLWCTMPIHFEWTHSIFKQKYSKSSKFDTFLKQRFICRLVGIYYARSATQCFWIHLARKCCTMLVWVECLYLECLISPPCMRASDLQDWHLLNNMSVEPNTIPGAWFKRLLAVPCYT